jgi:uridine kinase
MASSSNEVIIAVMGASGSGKSYFVQLATGDSNVGVGHTLKSGTL